MTYTKGSWEVKCKFGGGSEIKDFHTINDGRFFVGLGSDKANSYLMAAAPELLKALEDIYNSTELYKLLGCVYPPKIEALMVQAGAAIKKTKGDQND